jgi:hypothetical protein
MKTNFRISACAHRTDPFDRLSRQECIDAEKADDRSNQPACVAWLGRGRERGRLGRASFWSPTLSKAPMGPFFFGRVGFFRDDDLIGHDGFVLKDRFDSGEWRTYSERNARSGLEGPAAAIVTDYDGARRIISVQLVPVAGQGLLRHDAAKRQGGKQRK